MNQMPIMETERLLIRPFLMEDLEAAHHLLDIDLAEANMGSDRLENHSDRREWLQWAALNPRQLGLLNQPPYGDRAVILKSSGKLIGACGNVPCMGPFEQIPGFAADGLPHFPARFTTEFGLFWAISPAHRRMGYATEAAQALVNYAFETLHLKRIIAKSNFDNAASIGVMQKLGMRIERNPYPIPTWLQVVGVIEFD